MFGKIKTFALNIITGANAATIIIMLLIGHADRINPESSPMLSNIGLLFPVFIFINFFFIVLWVLLRPRMVIMPLAGYILCYFPVRMYCPLNVGKDVPVDAIKVLSYNVKSFDVTSYPPVNGNVPPAMEYIKNSEADIVCLQEARITEYITEYFGELYPYTDDMILESGGSSIMIMSKFPIIDKERIDYPSAGNLSAAFILKIGPDTVAVVNNHLETSGLSLSDRDGFNSIVHGGALKDTLRTESKRLIVKLGESAKKRAPQANAVAKYIQDLKGKSVILCGDFNDNPISYTHRTIAKELTDCYVECGNGPGWSYNRSNMRVRIDNIMCSGQWKPYRCEVDNKIEASDHYPIYCWLKMRDNQ